MPTLDTWAARWGVSPEAVADLRAELCAPETDPAQPAGESEAAVQARVRLEASAKGLRLWRNNVGACYTAEGSFMRYGLANDSAGMNRLVKSSDLVGLRPFRVGPQHVGHIVGQFVAREVKRAGWKYTGTEREKAQLNFLQLVMGMGGDAGFCASEGSL